jgi:hypothetical protein
VPGRPSSSHFPRGRAPSCCLSAPQEWSPAGTRGSLPRMEVICRRPASPADTAASSHSPWLPSTRRVLSCALEKRGSIDTHTSCTRYANMHTECRPNAYFMLQTKGKPSACAPAWSKVVEAIDHGTVTAHLNRPSITAFLVQLHPGTEQEHHAPVPAIFQGGTE